MTLLEKIIDTFDGTIVEDNQWDPYSKNYSCNCKGFMFRKKCRHIKELSDSFKRKLYE